MAEYMGQAPRHLMLIAQRKALMLECGCSRFPPFNGLEEIGEAVENLIAKGGFVPKYNFPVFVSVPCHHMLPKCKAF